MSYLTSQEIKERLDMRELIENVRGSPDDSFSDCDLYCCDFHHEYNASMAVYHDHIFCHACHHVCDIYDWLMDVQGLSFVDSKIYIKNFLKIADNEGGSPKLNGRVYEKTNRPKKERQVIPLSDVAKYEKLGYLVEPYLTHRRLETPILTANHVGGTIWSRRYKMRNGQQIELNHNRVAIPHKLGDQVYSMNFRRDEFSTQNALMMASGGLFDEVREDLAIQREKRLDQVSDERVMRALFGPKYQKPEGTMDSVFGIDQIMRRDETGHLVFPRTPYALLMEGEMNALAAQQAGYIALAVKASKNLDLQHTFHNVMIKYIIVDNDPDKELRNGEIFNAGEDNAWRLYEALGSERDTTRLVHLPDGIKDLNELAQKSRIDEFLMSAPYCIEPRK